MEPYLRISLVIEILVVGAAIQLMATGAHPRRLFTIDLGREKNEADRRLARNIQWGNALIMLAATVVLFVSSSPGTMIGAMLTASLLSPALLIYGHARVLKTIDRPQVSGRYLVPLERLTARELVSWPLQLANLGLILACSAAYAVILPSLPERMAVHWGVDGRPDRWGSPQSLWFILAMMLLYTGIIWFVAWMASTDRMALAPNAAEETRRLQTAKRQLTVRMTEWIMLGANVATAFCWLGLAMSPERIDLIVLVTIVISSLSIIGPLAYFTTPLLEIGDRLRELGGEALGTRAGSWRWGGQIYYAPDDPALFVPKRSGIGSTVNFARPSAWFLMLGLVLAIILIAIVLP